MSDNLTIFLFIGLQLEFLILYYCFRVVKRYTLYAIMKATTNTLADKSWQEVCKILKKETD